jgi:small conductance mechanosensitive channel
MTRPQRVTFRPYQNCVKSRFDPKILGYDNKIGKAREIIMGILDADDRVLKDPAAGVAVGELDSSVNLNVRSWVNSGDYWPVRADLPEGIGIPYPQEDVHMHEVKSVA